jgi:hypothetical protein
VRSIDDATCVGRQVQAHAWFAGACAQVVRARQAQYPWPIGRTAREVVWDVSISTWALTL